MDKKRSIALPVKVKQATPGGGIPTFLKRLSFLKHPEFSLGCGACKHMVEHAVEYARVLDESQPRAASGWRMDERKTVSARHQDAVMLVMFEALCEEYKPPKMLQSCSIVDGNLCEEVGPLGKSVQDSIKRACVDFVEFFEDDLTTALRQHESYRNLPLEFCREVKACK